MNINRYSHPVLTPEQVEKKKENGEEMVLRAASLNQLVLLLTPKGKIDNQYTKVPTTCCRRSNSHSQLFLLTYASFVDAPGLFLKLKQRYNGA